MTTPTKPMEPTFKLTAYFGLSRPTDGSKIKRKEFNKFLEQHALLPCYTLSKSVGCWNHQQEKTMILSVLCVEKDLEYNLNILKALAVCYCKDFDQESVLIEQQSIQSTLVSA